MLGHLVLAEGDHTAWLDEVLAIFGYHDPLRVQTEIEGAKVVSVAQRLQDAHPSGPLTTFAITTDGAWTVLSDLDGALLDQSAGFVGLSHRVQARVLALRFEPDACALSWFASGRLRRHVEQRPAGRHAEGDALPIEAGFGSPARLDEDDLLLLVQSLGVDVARLNERALYTLLAYAAWTAP